MFLLPGVRGCSNVVRSSSFCWTSIPGSKVRGIIKYLPFFIGLLEKAMILFFSKWGFSLKKSSIIIWSRSSEMFFEIKLLCFCEICQVVVNWNSRFLKSRWLVLSGMSRQICYILEYIYVISFVIWPWFDAIIEVFEWKSL